MTPTSSCRTNSLIRVAVRAHEELCAAATCTAQTGSCPEKAHLLHGRSKSAPTCTLRHGSARALRSARTLSRSWLSTAMINGGTMAASGCTSAPAPRSNLTNECLVAQSDRQANHRRWLLFWRQNIGISFSLQDQESEACIRAWILERPRILGHCVVFRVMILYHRQRH